MLQFHINKKLKDIVYQHWYSLREERVFHFPLLVHICTTCTAHLDYEPKRILCLTPCLTTDVLCALLSYILTCPSNPSQISLLAFVSTNGSSCTVLYLSLQICHMEIAIVMKCGRKIALFFRNLDYRECRCKIKVGRSQLYLPI